MTPFFRGPRYTVFFGSGAGVIVTMADIFKTISCPAGTNPVADAEDDTLSFTSTDSTVTVTGNSGTDTINFSATGTQLQGRAVNTAVPSANQVLAWNNSTSKWEGKTLTASDVAAVTAITSTDNAIPRFNSTAGQVQDSSCTIDDNDNLGVGGNVTVTGQGASTHDSESGSGTTHTVSFADGNSTILDLNDFSGAPTLTFSNPLSGGSYILIVQQDASSALTITWPGTVKWASGSAPTLSTGANALDVISFFYDGSNYYGSSSLNFS